MSIVNHPHFHAVLFATNLTSGFHENLPNMESYLEASFRQALRGAGYGCPTPGTLIKTFVYGHASMPSRDEIIDFVADVENWVDQYSNA